MSLDNRKTLVREYVKKIGLASAITAGGIGAIDIGVKKGLEEINRHLLTPAAITELKSVTGASDSDIVRLEPMLKQALIQELRRSLVSKK